MAPIRRSFGPGDLAPLLAGSGVDASIVVQCRSDEAETEELLSIAASTAFVVGVVGWIDLESPDVGVRLDRLLHRPEGGKLVGIRHQVHDEPDANWLSRVDVRRGLAAVFERGLAYDLLVRSREMPAALAVAREFPHGRLVLDHAGKPPIATGFDRVWADRLEALAACPNVWCKVSGLATEATWSDWDAERLRPAIDHAWHLLWRRSPPVRLGLARCAFWPALMIESSRRRSRACRPTDKPLSTRRAPPMPSLPTSSGWETRNADRTGPAARP
jgi:L-fuconolactonase